MKDERERERETVCVRETVKERERETRKPINIPTQTKRDIVFASKHAET